MTTVENVRQRAESDAKRQGYHLTPDPESLQNLLEGLRRNEERYGYPSCPCRLSSGKFEYDRDIICPCDYRDPDVEEFGYCYCAFYVRKDGRIRRENPDTANSRAQTRGKTSQILRGFCRDSYRKGT